MKKEQEFVQVNPSDVDKVTDVGILESITNAATQRIWFLREIERKKRADAENAARAKVAAERLAYEVASRRTAVSEIRKGLAWVGPVTVDDVLDILCAFIIVSGGVNSVNQIRAYVEAIQQSKSVTSV